jgi:hypothetical protein
MYSEDGTCECTACWRMQTKTIRLHKILASKLALFLLWYNYSSNSFSGRKNNLSSIKHSGNSHSYTPTFSTRSLTNCAANALPNMPMLTTAKKKYPQHANHALSDRIDNDWQSPTHEDTTLGNRNDAWSFSFHCEMQDVDLAQVVMAVAPCCRL